jgi:hypothetical protein
MRPGLWFYRLGGILPELQGPKDPGSPTLAAPNLMATAPAHAREAACAC